MEFKNILLQLDSGTYLSPDEVAEGLKQVERYKTELLKRVDIDEAKYKFHLKCALIEIKSMSERHGIVRGNITKVAKSHNVKFKDLLKAYNDSNL